MIFITENDMIEDNQSIYHIYRMIEETGTVFGDEVGIKEGRKENLTEVIRRMLENQFSYADIALSTGLTIEDIQKYIS